MTQRRRKFCPGVCVAGTPYQIIRFIGSGAMGAVYEVEHRILQKVFVMKILHEDLVCVDDSARRIRRESKLLAKLEHVNIVKVTDAGFTASNVPFFVMERLDGETLASRMRYTEKWPTSDVVKLAVGILDGLGAAHSLGIVHRDVKPSNIFLANSLGIKLLDFGIAKSVGIDATATAKGITLGTPRYMAPEQAVGGEADFRSDLYALGVVMYELLAGVHPFAQALTPVEMMIAQAGWQAPPLRVHDDNYFGLHLIVENLLAKDPIARPDSAQAVKRSILDLEHSNLHCASPQSATELTRAVAPQRIPNMKKRMWIGALSIVAAVSAIYVSSRAPAAKAANARIKGNSDGQVKPYRALQVATSIEGQLEHSAPQLAAAQPQSSSAAERSCNSLAAPSNSQSIRIRRIPGISSLPSAAPSAWPIDLVDLTRR